MTRQRWTWAAVAAIFILVPASFLLGMVLTKDSLAELDPPLVAVVEPAATVNYEQRTGVIVSPVWAPSAELYAPNWEGIVGDVQISAGHAIETGDAVATVAGVVRLGVATPEPFFRPLALGDIGRDVSWLNQTLLLLGHLDAAPAGEAQVSEDTLSAIESLAASLGVAGAAVFDPGWFIWLPQSGFAVESVGLVPGAPAPAPGTPIASGPRTLQGLLLRPIDGSSLQFDPDGQYLLAVGDADFPLDASGAVPQESLAEVAGALDPAAETLAGSVHRAVPLAVWAVPTAAVMTGQSGRLCVWVSGADGYRPLEVRVRAARAGVTFVDPAAADGTPILYNPAMVLADAGCP